MKLLLAALPTILLGACSQLTIRWRVTTLAATMVQPDGIPARAVSYLTDPYILGAYVLSLLSSVAWFFVLEKYPVSVAAPFYVGLLFCATTLGSALWLRENISLQHIAGMAIIVVGVAIVGRAA
jgi:drug/metabolite transporter (DMT)-like permease